VGLGCVVGGMAAVVITGAIRSILSIGQNPVDAVAFASVFVVLLATSVVASLSPARRAATADPIATLRQEGLNVQGLFTALFKRIIRAKPPAVYLSHASPTLN